MVARALLLADSEGLGAVTIRRLARDLGVTAMALYWHFGNKDELLDAMTDAIYAEIDPAVEASAPWQGQMRTLMASLAGALREHPSTAVLLATRNTLSEESMRLTEAALEILRRGGFSPTEAVQVSRYALYNVTQLAAGAPVDPPLEESAGLEDVQRRTRVFLESLPPERYPRLVEAAWPLSVCEDPDAYYDFGLDLLLSGIEAMAARKQALG